MPRPPKQGRTRAGSKTVQVRWTADEAEQLKQLAAQAGMTVSAYIRWKALGIQETP